MDDRQTEGRVEQQMREVARCLEALAREKGCAVDVPDGLAFKELFEILKDLGVPPAEFFAGVVRRWRRGRVEEL